MKTGIELVKEIRELARDRLLLSQQIADTGVRGLFEAADVMEAWLREAHEWTLTQAFSDDVREELLGTTRQEGEK